jgi:TolB protein
VRRSPPDGTRLVLELLKSRSASPPASAALYLLNADGSGLHRLTPFRLAAGDHPDWSPDGGRILFRSHADVLAPGSRLYTVRPDGTGLKQLGRWGPGTTVLSASFSPDGKRITIGLTGVGGRPDVFVMRSDGTGLRAITRTRAWDSAPDWGPG